MIAFNNTILLCFIFAQGVSGDIIDTDACAGKSDVDCKQLRVNNADVCAWNGSTCLPCSKHDWFGKCEDEAGDGVEEAGDGVESEDITQSQCEAQAKTWNVTTNTCEDITTNGVCSNGCVGNTYATICVAGQCERPEEDKLEGGDPCILNGDCLTKECLSTEFGKSVCKCTDGQNLVNDICTAAQQDAENDLNDLCTSDADCDAAEGEICYKGICEDDATAVPVANADTWFHQIDSDGKLKTYELEYKTWKTDKDEIEARFKAAELCAPHADKDTCDASHTCTWSESNKDSDEYDCLPKCTSKQHTRNTFGVCAECGELVNNFGTDKEICTGICWWDENVDVCRRSKCIDNQGCPEDELCRGDKCVDKYLANGELCDGNSKCASGNCGPPVVGANICKAKLANDKSCHENSQCISGNCDQDASNCQAKLENTKICDENSECNSGNCAPNPDDATSNICQDKLKDFNDECDENSECESGNCAENFSSNSPFSHICKAKLANGVSCVENSQCGLGNCAPNPDDATSNICQSKLDLMGTQECSTITDVSECRSNVQCKLSSSAETYYNKLPSAEHLYTTLHDHFLVNLGPDNEHGHICIEKTAEEIAKAAEIAKMLDQLDVDPSTSISDEHRSQLKDHSELTEYYNKLTPEQIKYLLMRKACAEFVIGLENCSDAEIAKKKKMNEKCQELGINGIPCSEEAIEEAEETAECLELGITDCTEDTILDHKIELHGVYLTDNVSESHKTFIQDLIEHQDDMTYKELPAYIKKAFLKLLVEESSSGVTNGTVHGCDCNQEPLEPACTDVCKEEAPAPVRMLSELSEDNISNDTMEHVRRLRYLQAQAEAEAEIKELA